MPADYQMVRALALALPDVSEGLCYGTPAFYLRRKLMLRFWEDGETLVVKFPRAERAAAIEKSPDVLSVTDHYLNYPCILVSLPAVDAQTLADLIGGAWRLLASRKQIAAAEAARAVF